MNQIKILIACISIHALLAESDYTLFILHGYLSNISIHALLAESDRQIDAVRLTGFDFYPRSPCGERPGLPLAQPAQ